MRRQGFRGAFTKLLEEHPYIVQLILFLHRQRGPAMPTTEIHKNMLIALSSKGLKKTEYPFNTYDRGRKPLYRFLKKCDDVICARPKPVVILPDVSDVSRNSSIIIVKRTICGNFKKGRRPYVTIDGERYKGTVLSQTPSLIGETITLAIDTKDIRAISAYSSKGLFLDNLSNLTLTGLDFPVTLDGHRRNMRECRRAKFFDLLPKDFLAQLLAGKSKRKKEQADDQRSDHTDD